MHRDELLRELERPRNVKLSRETWVAAAVLAGLRKSVNDPIRAQDRDRGDEKNRIADIWGVLGEMVAIRAVNEVCPEALVHHRPIDFGRPVNEVDMVVELDGGPLKMESKAHLLHHAKHWFLVNERAHQRSLMRGAEGYVPVVSVLGAPRARVGGLLSVAELSSWGPPDKPMKDRAIALSMKELSTRHLGHSLEELNVKLSGAQVATEEELASIARQAGADLEEWRRHLPALERMKALDLVDAVLEARDRVEHRRRA